MRFLPGGARLALAAVVACLVPTVGGWEQAQRAPDDPQRGGLVLFRSEVSPAGARTLSLDPEALMALRRTEGRILIAPFPLEPGGRIEPGPGVELEVERFHVTAPHTRFVVGRPGGEDRPLDFDPHSLVLLRGSVSGQPDSRVYLALSEGGMLGSIDLGSGRSRYVFGSANGPQRGLLTGPLTLSDVRRFAPPPMDEICGVQSPGDLSLPEGSVAGADFGGPRLLTIAADSDFDFFELFGDLDSAAAYATALYGAVSDLYLRDVGVRLELTFLRLWDQPEDLFNEPDPLIPFRDHWDETMQKVDRDAAQLLTGRRDLPYGGVAWVQAVCGPLAYSVAGYLLGSFDDPASPGSGNWDLIVSAHELGHNCGTFHTHDYGIDACAFGVAQRGTVMSYCHTTSGGVSNIDFRFHTQIQDVVESFLASQGCLIVDCNENGIADAFEFGLGMSTDRNGNGVPDECEDCNGNGVLDSSDIESGRSVDVNGNGIPDDCEPDCNGNGVPDSVDLAFGGSEDLYGNGIPDECEADCNRNGIADINEIQGQMNLDVDRNGVLDACQDCNGNGIDDLTELGGGLNLWVAGSDRPSIVEFHARSGAPVRTSDDGAIGDIQDLIIGPDGLVYVSSAATNAVASFDPASGAYLDEFVPAGSGGLNEPAGLLFRPGGSLLVASRGTDSILEFDGATGAFLGAAVAADSGGLGAPFGLSFDLDGNLLVTTGDDRVLRFDSRTGAPLGEVVASGAGGLTLPRGLLVLPDGDLLVASSGSDAVLRYDGEDGSFLGRFDRGGLSSGFWALAEPWHLRLSVDGSLVFVSSHLGNAAIHSYDRETGLFMRTFYVLDQDIASPTGFDIRPPSSIDCNQNLLPDDCDIARGIVLDADGNGVPDGCENAPNCPGDADGSGTVDVQDLIEVIVAWGRSGGAADLNGDGAIDVQDLVLVIVNWNSSCGAVARNAR